MKMRDTTPEWKRAIPSARRFMLSIAVSLIAVVALTLFAFVGHAAAPSYHGTEHYTVPTSQSAPASGTMHAYPHMPSRPSIPR